MVGSLSRFLMERVPAIAAELRGPGNEATFRQRFLAGLEHALAEDGLRTDIRLEEQTLSGRTDARIELLIFELKSPGELSKKGPREDGLRKLREYIESGHESAKLKSRYRGILTDGVKVAFLAYHAGSKQFAWVDAVGVPQPTGQELMPWAATAATIARLVPTMALPHLSAESLLVQFGPTTQLARDTLRALWKQLVGGDSEFTKLLYQQWRELFALAVEFSVTDRPGEDLVDLFQMGGRIKSKEVWDEAVFVVHTYYSLLLKLLALRIVDELGLAGRVSLLQRVTEVPREGLLEAERKVPELLGNVIERDVFSWPYCDVEWPPTKEVSAAISTMADVMQQFDVQGVRTDILRRVYQNTINPKLRKSLGEFYTPTWAAELLLDEVGFQGKGRILDPTCGSGTFLVAAIHRVLDALGAGSTQRARAICRNVVGYDLNPIAVATARLNYVISLVDTLAAETLAEPLSIPVFLADSLLAPTPESVRMFPHFVVSTRVGVFQVPILFPERTEAEIVEDTRKLLRLLRDHCTKPVNSYLDAVRREMGAPAEEGARSMLVKIHGRIHELQIGKQDGVWTSIMENFFAPLLQGRFEFVVGNPPWVIPRRTPHAYTNKVREAASNSVGDNGILNPAEKDFLVLKSRSAAAEKQYFACTPFVWKALRGYVAPGGRNAFLMTSSMFTALNSGGWRRWISRYNLLKIVDLTLVTDIHEGALCWSYIPVIENRDRGNELIHYAFCLPGERRGPEEWDLGPKQVDWHRWRIKFDDLPVWKPRTLREDGRRGPSDSPWLVAPPEVRSVIRKMYQRTETWNSGEVRLGDVHPMHMGFKADGWKIFAFKEPPAVEDGVANGTNLLGERVSVEASLVFATAVGRGVRAWSCDRRFAFLPIGLDGNPLEERAMREHKLAWSFLLSHKRDLTARAVVRLGYVSNWFGVLVPDAAKSGGKVAFRLMSTRLDAAVLPPTITFARQKTLLLPDQTIRFIPTGAGDESLYLAGLLNSTPIRALAYMCSTPKGGVPWREFKAWNIAFVPYPRFKSGSRDCQPVLDLAREFSRAPDLAEAKQGELDRAVGRIYGVPESEVDTLSEHLSLLMGPDRAGTRTPPEADDSEEDP